MGPVAGYDHLYQGEEAGRSARERMLAAAMEPATVLAVAGCPACHGTGEHWNALCACVLRGVFEDCYRRFRICARASGFERRVSFPMVPGRDRRRTWERRTENYLCDFALAARRVLGQETRRGRIFRWRYLCGATVEMVLERINHEARLHRSERPMSRRAMYELLAKMEARLGEEYLTLKPHALWPTWKYFGE